MVVIKKVSLIAKIKDLFKRKPCTVNDHLTFKKIPVRLSPAIILGVYRPEQTKILNVAVTTVDPNYTMSSHAAWMVEIQMQHANTLSLIFEYEKIEILYGVIAYKKGIEDFTAKPIKNT